MITKQDAIKYLESVGIVEISELGANVALFIDRIWGLHNVSNASIKSPEWNNTHYIRFNLKKSLATIDGDSLTRIVVIAHKMMMRVQIEGISPGCVAIEFNPRKSRNRSDAFYKWCPEIAEHIAEIEKDYM